MRPAENDYPAYFGNYVELVPEDDVLAALESGGASLLFALMAVGMTLVFAALASVRNHIPKSSAARSVGTVAAEPARR